MDAEPTEARRKGGVRLQVQIPAFNEQDSIAAAVRDIPREIPGVDDLTVVVINDGSSDGTSAAAREAKGAHILDLDRHRGLGFAHRQGLAHAIAGGADLVVNFDADLQYFGAEIGRLVAPLIEGKADCVIGDRRIRRIEGYPRYKLATQTFWNTLIGIVYGQRVRDATSGFRAYSRQTAQLLLETLHDDYTYSAESLYVLLARKARIAFVPISVRPTPRPSRLITNKFVYVLKFSSTFFRYLFRRIRL